MLQGLGRGVGATFDALGPEVVVQTLLLGVATAAEGPVAVVGVVAHRLALEVLVLLTRLLFDLVRRRGRPVHHRLQVGEGGGGAHRLAETPCVALVAGAVSEEGLTKSGVLERVVGGGQAGEVRGEGDLALVPPLHLAARKGLLALVGRRLAGLETGQRHGDEAGWLDCESEGFGEDGLFDLLGQLLGFSQSLGGLVPGRARWGLLRRVARSRTLGGQVEVMRLWSLL